MPEHEICPDCGGPHPCPCDVGMAEAVHQFYQDTDWLGLNPDPINLPTEEEVNEMAKRLGLDETPF